MCPFMARTSHQSLRDALGVAIREHRRRAGLSQERLAELAGLSTPYVSELERGRSSPTVVTLAAIGRALDVAASAILARAEALRVADDGFL